MSAWIERHYTGIVMVLAVVLGALAVWGAKIGNTGLSAIATTLAGLCVAMLAAREPLKAIEARNKAAMRRSANALYAEIAGMFEIFLRGGLAKDHKETFEAINRKLMLHGDAQVINAFADFTAPKTIARMERQPYTGMLEVEKLYRALRASVGFDDRALPAGRIIGLYLDMDAKAKLRRELSIARWKRGVRVVGLIAMIAVILAATRFAF